MSRGSLTPDVSASIVFSGSVLAWSIAYLGIIYRGFRDRTYGMPMAALASNLSWEACWAFIIMPFSDLGHILTIPWFCIDVVIAVQGHVMAVYVGEGDVRLPQTRIIGQPVDELDQLASVQVSAG